MSDDVFHGRQATVQVGDPIDGVSDTEDISSQFTSNTDYTGDVMDITVTDPEAAIELENTFGGQFKVETPSDLVEIEVTMRFRDQEVFSEIHGTSSSVGSTDFNRISGTTGPGNTPEKGFLFELEKDGDIVRYFANYAMFQSFGEVSLDAEGFAEITGTVVCLVEDRYIEQNF